MVKRVSSKEVRARFDEIADSVRATGEPVIVENEGEATVALVSVREFEAMEQARRERASLELARLGRQVAQERQGPGPTEEEVVEALKQTREDLYRERFGTG